MDINSNIIEQIISLAKDDPKIDERSRFLANCIKTGKYTITQLVQDLGSLLTSTAVDDREKGSLILSLVLTYLPEDILSPSQLNFICNFYSDRLNDQHQVVPAVIRGLTPLVSSKNIPEGLSTHLLNSLLQHVPCQQQQIPDRYNIYVFIKTLLDKRKEEMKAMGLDLVYHVISTIENEQNPANLLFIFNWLPEFFTTIQLGHLSEEMFDVISAYFPVDFRPSVQDESKITREKLALALCPVLCAVPSFANLCIPLALEKLGSELRIAKSDSLDLLIEGYKIFPLDAYKPHSSVIWSFIQKEVFLCKDRDDKELEEKCLKALKLLLRKISPDKEFSIQITKDIIDTLKGNLIPDAVFFTPSSKLVKSISQASPQIANFVFNETSSMLINIYNITLTPVHKATILKQLIDITFTNLSTNPETNMEDTENLKLVPRNCLKAIISSDPEVRSAGIYGFSQLAEFVSSTTRNYFYQNLSSLIVTKQNQMVQEAMLGSLKVFAQLYCQEIKNILETIQTNGLESHKLYLEAVGSVVSVNHLMAFSLSILVANTFKTLDESIVAIKILRNKFEENELVAHRYLIEEENIIEKMVVYFLENVKYFNVETHKTFFDDVANILIIAIRYIDQNTQEELIRKQLERTQSTLKHNELVIIILFGLLSSVHPEVKVPIDVFDIFNITVQTKSSYICKIGSQLLANVINKCTDENTLLSYLNFIEEKCESFISINKQIDNVINIMSFTTKALVIQSSPYMFSWVNKLIILSERNLNAAKAFKIMLDDSYDCLNTKNYCKRRLLYKQKFFSELTSFLVANYEENKKYYLIILGYILQSVSQQILQLELKKIITLVLLCLSYCEVEEVLYTVLSSMNFIIENKDPLAEDYVQEFLKYYSKLATFEKSMKIRILAIKGIQLYTDYPLYKLLPLKQNMLMVLSKCLDDKKRLVRKEAVEARSRWFLIDAPI